MKELVLELRRLFEPLAEAADSLDGLKILLMQLGWRLEAEEDNWPSIRKSLAFVSLIKELEKVLDNLVSTQNDPKEEVSVQLSLKIIANLMSKLGSGVVGSQPPPVAPFDKPEFWADLGADLFGFLVHNYLEAYRPALAGILGFLGIVTTSEEVADVPLLRHRVHFDRLPRLFYDLPGLVAEEYGWGDNASDQEFEAVLFLSRLGYLANGLGANVLLTTVSEEFADIYYATDSPYREPVPGLEMQLLQFLIGDTGVGGVWLVASPIPPADRMSDSPEGIVVFPVVEGSTRTQFQLAASLGLILHGQFESSGAVRLEIRPNGVTVSFDQDLGLTVDTGLVLRYDGGSPTVLIGSASSSNFQIGSSQLDVEVNGPIDATEVAANLDLQGGKLIIDGGDGDGFLQKILPPEGIEASFDFGMAWSTTEGLRFYGSGALEVDLPVHISLLDVININSIYLSIGFSGEGIPIMVGLTGGVELGPIAAFIKRVGVVSELTFPERGGNLGNADIGIGFLPPTGVGLAVDASGIAGGGVIKFDADNERYAGMLGLNFGDFGLTAIGLITTRLPDGSKGFSMLVIIGVTFTPPIQLVMGFTLSGVGGLLGINRSMNIEFLQKGIRHRTLDPILFPDLSTFIQNADSNFSILRSAFEPVDGRYIVGPMVKIGWGNNIITADIGIFLEFPAPIRIVLMGQVEAAFPKPDDPVVVLNLDVLGVLDIEKKELTFQASLYGSRILSFPLAGDSAFLLGWGQDRRLALSLGGFHPKFTPPPPPIVFADLKRLSLSISSGPDFQLAGTAYQALTPNSLQFGSWVLLYAKKGKATVTGHLGFDTLIYFSPFSFEVTIGAGVRVKYRGKSLAEIDLSLVLSGPTPWNARGKAKIKILGVSIKVRFNFTWGRSEAVLLESVDPWPELQKALANPGSWGSALPPGRSMVAFLRSFEDDGTYVFSVPPNHADTLDLGELSANLRQEFAENGIEFGQSAIVQVMEPGSAWKIVGDDDASSAYIIRAGSEALDVYDGSHQIIVHPSGRLEVKQNVVPLGVKLALFGNAPVAGHDLFNIESLTSGDEPLDCQPVQEFFARGQFEQLSADQRLSLPAFEKMPGGVAATASTVRIDGEVESKALGYESILIKPDRTSEPAKPGGMAWDEAQHIARASEAQRWAQRAGSRKRFSTADMQPQVGVPDEELYCIVNAADLTRADLTLSMARENRNLTRMVADQELEAQRADGASELMVIPEYEVAT